MKTFGIRHFSPAGAYFVRQFLDKIKPDLVLIEGPADFDFLIDDIVSKKLVPPFAIMAYTKEAPIDTILYPFAEYSPEYQAIIWARENNKECRFFDLESDIMLGFGRTDDDTKDEETISKEPEKNKSDVDMEGFWERNLEQSENMDAYRAGSALFGESLRKDTKSDDKSFARDIIRESFMKRKINEYIKKGFAAF